MPISSSLVDFDVVCYHDRLQCVNNGDAPIFKLGEFYRYHSHNNWGVYMYTDYPGTKDTSTSFILVPYDHFASDLGKVIREDKVEE